ncbi:MAG: NADH-quinone oxidoreductase subunit NuoH [Candidatus Aminicenantes bacterium]|nr:NADH-quinone oxidoreductase subunit NuoH [Candidatus Aminicenantes bacterium]
MIDILIILIKIIFAMIWFLVLSLYLTWAERKESAVMQDRIGANRANIYGFRILGLFQPFADAIKMFFKEDFTPSFSRKFIHNLAPFLSFFFVLVTIAAIPFGDVLKIGEKTIKLQVLDMNVGVLFVLAMLTLTIYGVLLSGWASNNRWTIIGGLRGTAQLISYEVALGLSLVGLVMVFPSLNFSAIVETQGELLFGWLPKWGIFIQPLGFIVFLIAAVAESERVPFDLPEGESEIVGFFTEYSGLKWGLYMFTDFMKVLIISCLLTTLFFGGWQVPWLYADGFHFPWGGKWLLPHGIVVFFQVLIFNLKVFFFCWMQILIRWTYPRFRYDQLMDFGWKFMIPLSIFNVVATAVLMRIL